MITSMEKEKRFFQMGMNMWAIMIWGFEKGFLEFQRKMAQHSEEI